MRKELTKTELKQIRRELEFNQKQMAGLLGVSLSAYKKYEQGKRGISSDLLVNLYNVLSRQAQHSLESSIDWLKIRFKTLDYKAVVKDVLKMEISDFVDSDKTRVVK